MTTTTSQVEHATFTLDRTYPAPVERVWAAWSTLEAKARWFGTPDAHDFDFRVGGKEAFAGEGPNASYSYEATFFDIVENERIVAAYEMGMDGRRISVSVYTMTLTPTDTGTRLTLTEQGTYLDGLDKSAYREAGTADLLDKLGEMLVS